MTTGDFTNDPLAEVPDTGDAALRRAGGRRAAREGLDEANLIAEPKPVAAMNLNHALVIAGGRTLVLMEIEDPSGRPDYRFISINAFAGSGTTGVAVRAEGFDATLIERDATYAADIRRRLDRLDGAGARFGNLLAGADVGDGPLGPLFDGAP